MERNILTQKPNPEEIKNFEEAKKTYLTAKVLYDLATEKTQKLNAPIHEALERGEITEEEWATKTTENDQERWQVSDLRLEAEKQLLLIAKEMIHKISTPEQWVILKTVYEDGPKYPHIKKRLLETTLCWNPAL